MGKTSDCCMGTAVMKTNMLVFGSLYLLLGWMLPLCACKTSGIFITKDDQSIPLDMVDNSVDDMYSTCATKMEAKVKGTYFKKEMKNFKNMWITAEKCAEKKIKEREKGDEALTKDHLKAICAYTAGGPENFYRTFNEAVRTNRTQYGSNFSFHSLHFWLTRAIQILKTSDGKCHTTFRRTNSKFTGVVSKVIRFGTFTSTSSLSTLTSFGKTTCFKIRTCHGAYLKKYPKLGDREQEVLIPPYETFKIISKDKPMKQLSDCNTVYILNSTGVQSNLDCQITE
ncbi:erythroblast NAD(P)(+)--arginine ADP-ribosyltransferase-like [Xiphophorus couchianus]|uniref:erythroblast NAD(P)(+)--arginine ADP-ribosyltransferase-like n=1 Tax=Xiphophorus couchianus TaxID=32473 RepID=UPI001016BC77|nr:erythroblast NAD(P)(+)--arginine ADP-ribosyltransferase-like [Xiphophorus couchianus]